MRHWVVRTSVVAAAVVAMMTVAAPVSARPARGGGGSGPAGYDIGNPQCNGTFPQSPTFGVVGVNNGIVFSANPCLGTGSGSSELAWAEAAANHAPSFYANTANPGPAYSSHWPVGQSAPQVCSSSSTNASGCSFDYGWNAAKDSFQRATTAESQLHGASFDGRGAAARATWWLDVETTNSWETLESAYGQTAAARENDTQSLLGAVAALRDSGVTTVGVYSTSYQWGQITGGSPVTGTRFSTNPSWVAGSSSATAAKGLCGTTGFTGAPVKLAQYPLNGFDGDVAC